MNKLATATLAMLLLGSVLSPSVRSDESSKWQGYLLDRECADSVREDSDPKTFIHYHTKDCALMANCRAKGYSIYTANASGNKWFNLDKKGNELAVRLLKASKRRSGFYVEVIGTRENSVLKTQMIREIDVVTGQCDCGRQKPCHP